MSRRAKIVSTIGPSSNTVETLEKLIMAGINVARINMSPPQRQCLGSKFYGERQRRSYLWTKK
jgi:pyruvate kinase